MIMEWCMADVLSEHTSHSTHATKSHPIHSYRNMKWMKSEMSVRKYGNMPNEQRKRNTLKLGFITSRPHIAHPSTTVQLCSINGLSTRSQSKTNTTQPTCISPEKRMMFVCVAQIHIATFKCHVKNWNWVAALFTDSNLGCSGGETNWWYTT